jgi:predicted ABC-type ATPase
LTSPGAPLLWVIAGPNGAGKTTCYEELVRPRLAAEFVNADRIAASRWPDEAGAHAYEAAELAAKRRSELLLERRSFVAETVFSHPSKIELMERARDAGYVVWLTVVGLENAELAVRRVAERVASGGHPVPEQKIRERYERITDNARRGVVLAHRSFVLDNGDPRRPLRTVLTFQAGAVVFRARPTPRWCLRMFAHYL